MLFAAHSIGLIKLDAENPTESQVLIPAKERYEINWNTANRLATENRDFMDYVKLVKQFYQTGEARVADWMCRKSSISSATTMEQKPTSTVRPQVATVAGMGNERRGPSLVNTKLWEYYLNIEADLAACGRFVEFVEDNYQTYSNEFARIIVIACAEIDAILGQLCHELTHERKVTTIRQYYPIVVDRFPKFTVRGLNIVRHKLSFHPWREWTSSNSPAWWLAYNKIKHKRYAHFEKANLGNALNAVGALFLVILHDHLYRTGDVLHVEVNRGAKLFTPEKAPTDKSGVYWYYGLD